MLHVPTAGDELAREPVQQRGVHGRFALRAHVVEHLRETHAEELSPQPVHEDARGERVFLRDNPLGQVEAGQRRIGLRVLLQRHGQESGQRGLHRRAALVHPVAARQDADGALRLRHHRDDALGNLRLVVRLRLLRAGKLGAKAGQFGREALEVREELVLLGGGALVGRDLQDGSDVGGRRGRKCHAGALGVGRRGEAEATEQVVLRRVILFQLDRQCVAGFERERGGEFQNQVLRLADFRQDRPAERPALRIGVNRRGGGPRLVRVLFAGDGLLEGRAGGCELHRLRSGLAVLHRGDDFRQHEVAVSRTTRAFAWQRVIGQRLDAQAGHFLHAVGDGHGVSVLLRAFAAGEDGVVALDG